MKKTLSEFSLPNPITKDHLKKDFVLAAFFRKALETIRAGGQKIPELTEIDLDEIRKTVAYEFKNSIYSISLFYKRKDSTKKYFLGYFELYPHIWLSSLLQKTDVFVMDEAFLHFKFVGRGLGEKVYNYIIMTKKILCSGSSQSPGAIKLWKKMINDEEKYSVFFYVRINLTKKIFSKENLDANYNLKIKSNKKINIFDSSNIDILIVKKNSSIEKELINLKNNL